MRAPSSSLYSLRLARLARPPGTLTFGRSLVREDCSGTDILRDMAKAAARGWQFKPPKSAVGAFSVRLTFIFHDDLFVPPQRKPNFMSPYQVEIARPRQSVLISMAET